MKKKFSFIFLVFSVISSSVIAQLKTVGVTDQTIKIGGTKSEEIYIGFAAGDKILFNFEEVNKKELKEIEILEYPGNSKFSDFKTSKVENKSFSVSKQSVYIFRFKNSALAGRICKINIQRIPASEETINFNTAVSWVTKQDTSWNTFTKDVVIGYDTTYQQKTKKELIKTEQIEDLTFTKNERVKAGQKSTLFFTLPQNSVTNNKTTKVIAWAYWVGVGEEANLAWQSNSKAMKSAVQTGASYLTTPLGALAIGLITELVTPKLGEDVAYSIVSDEQNRSLFLANQPYKGYDQGKGVAGYKKFNIPGLCQGTYFVCLYNDNILQAIDVTIKMVAILEMNEYEDKVYTEMIVNPRYEKQLFKEPNIKSYKTAITGV
jgi:hypothetical protein